MKKIHILISIAVLTATISILLFLLDKKTNLVLGAGGLVFFLIAAFWAPPPKHKNFTYKDLEKATYRALGGGGKMDIPEPNNKSNNEKKQIIEQDKK